MNNKKKDYEKYYDESKMSDKKRQKSSHYVYHYVIRKKSTWSTKERIKREGPIDKKKESKVKVEKIYKI